jgi:hypothetical protein
MGNQLVVQVSARKFISFSSNMGAFLHSFEGEKPKSQFLQSFFALQHLWCDDCCYFLSEKKIAVWKDNALEVLPWSIQHGSSGWLRLGRYALLLPRCAQHLPTGKMIPLVSAFLNPSLTFVSVSPDCILGFHAQKREVFEIRLFHSLEDEKPGRLPPLTEMLPLASGREWLQVRSLTCIVEGGVDKQLFWENPKLCGSTLCLFGKKDGFYQRILTFSQVRE